MAHTVKRPHTHTCMLAWLSSTALRGRKDSLSLVPTCPTSF